ncbi:MAG: polyprenyl synthetase family protein [Bdellovibrio sp.]|nr:polyprenyl synthetase family protein [Bdellovibrio sp.]
MSPLQNFTNSGSNLFRARLVELSMSLCSSKSLVFTRQFQKEISLKLSKLLEALHAGSLIIDDIQDGALTRRGRPALHAEIGTPLAINSGIWLYFWALDLIEKMGLEPRTELDLTRLCHKTLFQGHLGQALDLGVRIDEVSQQRARELSISALKLKTGTLMSLASELGAVVCGVHPEVREALKNFGLNFGFALQSFNDLGEYALNSESISQDLILGRPSWIWVCASEHLTSAQYLDFTQSVQHLRVSDLSTQKKLMLEIKKQPLLNFARSQAKKLMADNFQKLSDRLSKFDYEPSERADWKELQRLGQKVMDTYV